MLCFYPSGLFTVKVMSDDLLQEETKLADKEEEARKERIAMKHQSVR